MTITATLEALHSRRDIYGNVYWALRYIDHGSGLVVEAKISGGESNIYAMLRYWGKRDDWDRSVRFVTQEFAIREFNRMTKDWPYAGCRPEDIATFVRKQLDEAKLAELRKA